jgi:ribose transport system substrate-binding protein
VVRLDQGKHPMRFAVAASTVSGLLVVLLTAAAGRMVRSWPSWHGFLPLFVALGWALAALPVVLRAHRRTREPKRVFLILAAFTGKHWVAELIRDLHENLERRGYDMVLKIPDRDYSAMSQVRLLDGILSHRDDYAGGFIMVNEGEAVRADLARFCSKAGMPVVFVDAEPFEGEDAYPPGTAYAGCDDGKIGAAAAQWVTGYLRGQRIRHAVVLVINGGHYHRREQTFQRQLEAEVPAVQLISDCAGFDRSRAREVVGSHLRSLDEAGQRIDAVFCTNDEMALGAADALLFSGIPWAEDTVVAGVDGTPDARALIEAPTSPLRATVVQDAYKVAEAAVGLLERMFRKEPVPKRTSVPVEILASASPARHNTAQRRRLHASTKHPNATAFQDPVNAPCRIWTAQENHRRHGRLAQIHLHRF